MDELSKKLGSPRSVEPAPQPELLTKTARSLATPFRPRSEAQLAGLRKQLSAAGYHAPSAIAVYATARLLTLVGGGFLASTAAITIEIPHVPKTMFLVLGLLGGLYLPTLFLRWLGSRRQRRIIRTLPDALDLLIVSIDVGQGLDAALRSVIERLSPYAGDLCAEFQYFLKQLDMGVSRRDALHQLGARAAVTDLNSFAAVLIQADRFGSSIAESLRSLSESMRIRRRQQAEEKAQQVAVKLVFPLVLFIFPGIFAVLVGPAAISLYRDFVAAN